MNRARAPLWNLMTVPLVTRTTALDRLCNKYFLNWPRRKQSVWYCFCDVTESFTKVTSHNINAGGPPCMPIPLVRQCNHCGREEYYKKTLPVKRHRILRIFENVCAAQQPTAKTRQFESNAMRAAVSKNIVKIHTETGTNAHQNVFWFLSRKWNVKFSMHGLHSRYPVW